ncbi:hypothetical protein TSOC_010369 [Tetrabaena socialis]|uniref:Rhodanese domain-containing protein n=1 Tax=Tetrabaena socialis TaxID=47790 RepID=A0A2J7ZTE6_9CHLO|nr:hypothetical protein TSOC_010369 [Tetrabaena socialis]|eukprot:PNH03545.1 hypothetical protein TSOC_010369 [Tetrabaena socialis]
MPIYGLPFSDEQLFNGINLILPAWVLLLVAPRWKYTATISAASALLMSAFYAALLVTSMLSGPETAKINIKDMFSLQGVSRLMATPSIVLPCWVHYAAFDLWVGRWMAADAVGRGMPQLLLIPCLACTLFFGPGGFLIYWAVRLPFKKANGKKKSFHTLVKMLAQRASTLRVSAQRPASLRRPIRAPRLVVRAGAAEEEEPLPFPLCKPTEVKKLYQDKGYVVLDIRTPEENDEASKKWFVNLPVAFETEKGPKFNGKFRAQFQAKFANKMSRVILACDDGNDRTGLAASVISELGYTSILCLEGGIDAYLKVDPLTAQDKKPKWRLTGQTSGVRYAYNDGDEDDSA